MGEFLCRAFPVLNCDSSGSSGSLVEEPSIHYDEDFMQPVPEPTAGLLFAAACVGTYLWSKK